MEKTEKYSNGREGIGIELVTDFSFQSLKGYMT